MSKRIEKVNALLKKEVANLIKDTIPEDLGLITVIDCETSPDLKNALVFISCLDKNKEKEILTLISSKSFDFQHVLGKKLNMRYTPKLTFKIDESSEKIDRIEEILTKMDVKNGS